MEHAAIDLGKFHSQIAILSEAGELVEKRIRTERQRFEAIFAGRPRAKVLIEASTESEWVARLLEGLGHEVVVGDPNYAAMYAGRSRRVKTDRRDSWALLQACVKGVYRTAHRLSDEQGHARIALRSREALVRARTRLIGLTESLLRKEGYRVRSGSASCFPKRVLELSVPERLGGELEPLLRAMRALSEQIRLLTAQLKRRVAADETTARLTTAPGVGTITAASFVATLDRVDRFRNSHQVEAYIGLVPAEMSSGEKQHRGHITKIGSSQLRYLLVEAAWSILIRKRADSAGLRSWAEAIAQRRGRRVAVVALARRLAGILYAMWRDRTNYDPQKLSGRGRRREQAA